MRIFSFAVLIIVLNIMWASLTNLPQDVGADVPDGKLNGLSFAPFREGQAPMLDIFPSPAQIDEDLKLMGKTTYNIRTYASLGGSSPIIPELARKYGLTMIQGGWLSGTPKDNKKEIAELIRSANANPDVVKRVMVGNEVLLRKELTAEQLIQYIREVKKAVKQPVSYADVWSMYMKHPELIKEVDFVTIHILPYWEDRPITIDDAPAHIERIVKKVQQEINAIAPNKPILIGESGWPGAGRQRGWAVPSVVNEAQFIRALIRVAKDNNFDYNIVEAFNQSWKSQLEGVVGANWGLYAVDRSEVFPLTGKVYEHPNWHKGLIASIVIFVMVALRHWQSLQNLATPRLLIFLGVLQLLSVLLVSQMEQLWYTSYSDVQRLQTLAIVGLNLLTGGLILRHCHAWLTDQTISQQQGALLYKMYSIFTSLAFYQTCQLAFNGRYLSFPTPSNYIPVVGLVTLIAVYIYTHPQWTKQSLNLARLLGDAEAKPERDKIMGWLLLSVIVALIIGETYAFLDSGDLILEYPDAMARLWLSFQFTLTNGQLVTWLFALVILAVPFLLGDHKKEA